MNARALDLPVRKEPYSREILEGLVRDSYRLGSLTETELLAGGFERCGWGLRAFTEDYLLGAMGGAASGSEPA